MLCRDNLDLVKYTSLVLGKNSNYWYSSSCGVTCSVFLPQIYSSAQALR